MRPRHPKLVAYPLLAAFVASAFAALAEGAWDPLLQSRPIYGVRATASVNRGCTPLAVASGDFNGDGLPDLAVSNGTLGGGVSILLHTESSGYASAFKAGGEYPGQRAYSVAVADLNADGRQDVVTSHPTGIAYLLNSGVGFTTGLRSRPNGDIGVRVAAGDMDGDGIPEVAEVTYDLFDFRIAVARGPIHDPTQPYSSVYSLPSSVRVKGFSVADVTGDGRSDVIVAYSDTTINVGALVILANYSAATGFGTILQTNEPGLTELEVALLNGDAIPDVAVVNEVWPGVSVFIGTGGGSFLPPSHVSTCLGDFVRARDLDGDGDQELITIPRSDGASTLCVNRGRGDGTFVEPQETYDGVPGSGPPILVDVNGDGKADLVAPETAPDKSWNADQPLAHSVGVVLRNGLGGFRTGPPVYLGPSLGARAIADFNRDGKPDLAAANGNNVQIGIGAGDGTFSAGASVSVGSPMDMLVAGDTNRDGKADLWIQNGTGVQGYSGLGDGTFGPGGVLLPGILYSRSIADVNRDGWPDLILGNGGFIRAFVQFGPDFFGASSEVMPSVGITSIATGDWNRDGLLDLAVAGPSGASTFLGLGAGPGGWDIENVLITGRAYTDVCAGDFNRDGIPDLAIRENAKPLPLDRGVDVFLGNGTGGFTGPTSLGTLEHTGLEIRTWDANLDGIQDLIAPGICDDGGSPYLFSSVDYFLGTGAGGFGLRSTYDLGPVYTFGPHGRGFVNAGDIDRNSVPDLLTGGIGHSYLGSPPNRGNGLRPTAFYPTLNNPHDVAIGDLNRDGKLDAVSASLDFSPGVAVHLGTGGGALGPATPLTQSWNTHRVRLADLNRDGILDILASNYGSGLRRVSSMLGVGNGTFGPRTDLFINANLDFEVGDINRDDIPDIVTATQDSVRVLIGSGTGTFTPSTKFAATPVYDLDLADLNRDGLLDVLCAGNTLSISYGHPSTGIGPRVTLGGPITSCTTVCAADFNRDGFLDILAPQGNDYYVLWGADAFTTFTVTNLPFTALDVKIGEAAANGLPYVYVTRPDGVLEVLSVGGFGSLTSVGSYTVATTPDAVVLGDMDRDGVIDAVSVGSGGSSLAVTLHGGIAVTGVTTPDPVKPRVQLAQNHPNPFNPSTTIRFTLPERNHVRLTIHDVRGRLVSILEDRTLPAGEHSVPWRGVDAQGHGVASGVYFYRLATESGAAQSKRMVVVK